MSWGTVEIDLFAICRLRVSDYKFLTRKPLERKDWVKHSITARWRDERKTFQQLPLPPKCLDSTMG